MFYHFIREISSSRYKDEGKGRKGKWREKNIEMRKKHFY